jgi:hypothetical protein
LALFKVYSADLRTAHYHFSVLLSFIPDTILSSITTQTPSDIKLYISETILRTRENQHDISPDQSISSIHTSHHYTMSSTTAPSLAPITPSHPLALDSNVEPQVSAASPVSPSSTNPPAAGPMVCLCPFPIYNHLPPLYLSPSCCVYVGSELMYRSTFGHLSLVDRIMYLTLNRN